MTVKVVREDDGFDLPRLNVEEGTAFGWFDRWNIGMTPDGKYATDLADWEARDMHEMLTKDYKAQQMERVLSLPVTSAEYAIQPDVGDKGEANWLKEFWQSDPFNGGCETSLDQIIGLCTSAFYYRRSYFEKVFAKGTGRFAGKIVYKDVAFRPQNTCRLLRDPRTGKRLGFEQEAYYLGAEISRPNKWPIQIKNNRAFVFTHGTRRDPLNGTSDMEVAYWAWKTKQKILMLWFQFLQGVSLPRITVKSSDLTTSQGIANEIARMKGSGVLPLAVPGGPNSVAVETLDASGKGSEQFQAAINWLDHCATDSILAGFLNLTGSANMSHFGGSYALSKDASDFFLQQVEAKARELEDQIRRELFAPLIFANFGRDAAVPRLVFEPLNDIDKESAIELLKAAMAAPPGGPMPTSFISELAGQVATYLGMDGEKAREDFKASFDAAAAQAQAQAVAQQGAAGATPIGQAVAGMAGAVGAASNAIKAGQNPKAALGAAKQAHSADQKAAAAHNKAQAAAHAMVQKHAKNAVKAKTGGDVALSHEDTDLAGFNPAEPRAGGKWTSGGAQGSQAKSKGAKVHAALLAQKAHLTAEAAHLRAEIARARVGVHHGVAGRHNGPAGTKKPSTSGGKAKSVGSAGAGKSSHPSLQQQVIALQQEVSHLRNELITIEEQKAKRKNRSR